MSLKYRFGAARLLLLIRDKKATTWDALCRETGLEPGAFHTGHILVKESLIALRGAGLIDFREEDKEGWGGRRVDGEIQVSTLWERVQQGLGISLTQVAELDADGLVVFPFLGRPKEIAHKPDIFVLMPFSSATRPVYDDHIKKVTSALGLSTARADDFFSVHSVMTDVWSGIFFARAVIADCTGRNPNVFYEIGLAHVLGKPVVLITQTADDVPFDVRYLRHIQYAFTPRGMADFEGTLRDTLLSIL